MTEVFTKTYADRAACHTAAANHRWLGRLGLELPALLAERPNELDFGFIHGRHAEPQDLIRMASYLGRVHELAFSAALHRARLDTPFSTGFHHRIPDFVTPRLRAVDARLRSGLVPDPLLSSTDVGLLLRKVAGEPAAFYKDTNPRNVLITADGPVMVDFDDLTLAPFGYDLAKLVVTLAMTHGVLPEIGDALITYNAGLANITAVSWDALMTWAELHHILTSPYLGRGGYAHGWNELRPQGDRRR